MKQTGHHNRLVAHEHPFYADMASNNLAFVAHRGGDGGYENTLAAFEAAENAGVKIIETDIVNTCDDVPVHFHGNRQTRKIVRATSYSDLNMESTYSKIGFEGDYIPTLDESLDYFPGLKFFLDLKSKKAPLPVARSIKQADAQDRVSIDGEHWKRAVAVSKEIPDVSTTIGPIGLVALYSGAKNMPGYKTLKNRYLLRATSLSLPINRVTKPLLEIANELEVPVFLYRVHDESDVEQAIEYGARGIMADRLSLLGHRAVSAVSQRPRLQLVA